MSIADEEDVSDNSPACSLALLVEQVLIPDLDMKVLVLKILSDNLYLLLVSEFASCLCLSAKVVILLCSKHWETFLSEKLRRRRIRRSSAVDCRFVNGVAITWLLCLMGSKGKGFWIGAVTMLRMSPPQYPSILCCCSLANINSLGAALSLNGCPESLSVLYRCLAGVSCFLPVVDTLEDNSTFPRALCDDGEALGKGPVLEAPKSFPRGLE